MENKKSNKKIFIIIFVLMIIILLIFGAIYMINKNEDEMYINEETTEENEIEQNEKSYKENINYSYFYDEEANIKFYYDRKLKLKSSDIYKFYAISGDSIYSTSISYEFKKMDTQNLNFIEYIEKEFSNTKVNIQEVTISKISPIIVQRVDVIDENLKTMDMTFYEICNKNGIARIGITNLMNPTIPNNISEILDTVIVRDKIN